MKPYERFEAWRLCHELTLETYRITKLFRQKNSTASFPRHVGQRFHQRSTSWNGQPSGGSRECRRFLDISLASLAELAYVFRLAEDLGYATAYDRL